MTPFSQRLATLILKNLRHELTAEEEEELFAWVNQSEENKKMYSALANEASLGEAMKEFYESDKVVWQKIAYAMNEEPAAPVRRMRPWRLAAAACITLLVAAGVYWYMQPASKSFIADTPIPATVKLEDISAPQGSHSTLTLGNGSVIVIDEASNGVLVREGSAAVMKKAGAIEYDVTSVSNNVEKPEYHTLKTGNGGQQKIILPDGSEAWINAESSLTYPTVFAGSMRSVKISGEVYFEIKSLPAEGGQGKLPFIVEILGENGEKKSQVEVLGTHFNINAYGNEAIVRTTLLEGKVRILTADNNNPQSAILRPGQQAQLGATGKLRVVNDADVEATMAWKNGEFVFRSVDTETILREAARWYNITVSYPNGISKDKYNGTISRSMNLSQLLKIFDESGIKFKLEEGKKLIVMP